MRHATDYPVYALTQFIVEPSYESLNDLATCLLWNTECMHVQWINQALVSLRRTRWNVLLRSTPVLFREVSWTWTIKGECTPLVTIPCAPKSKQWFCHLHVALNASSALMAQQLHVGHVQPHRTVKRARSVVQDRDATVQVPRSELLDILSKRNSPEQQVAALLPSRIRSPTLTTETAMANTSCSLLGASTAKRVRNASGSMEAMAAAQKKGPNASLKSSGATPDKDAVPSSSSSKENEGAANVGSPSVPSAPIISVDSSDDQAAKSAAVGYVTAVYNAAESSSGCWRLHSLGVDTKVSNFAGSRRGDPSYYRHGDEDEPDGCNHYAEGHGDLSMDHASRATEETKFQDYNKAKLGKASRDTKDADKRAEKNILPSGNAKIPSCSMGSNHILSNSTVQEVEVLVNDEPCLSTVLTETPMLVGSESTPALTSELSNAGARMPASKGAAETKQ
ncbi:hypothetical protein TCAP_01235 [Tolypocladium capitatum]|uniref:Uncharacterized protein n=1 Tax=Tolypocladium capitatum TaxID=45235 RepID=A0A2K3QMT9_9HYPO|nr:hypothetical protein TCAP_01235 [Tolypocladium capitatum]